MNICSVKDCDAQVHSLGYCRKHHARYKRHGDALAGRTGRGEVSSYFEKQIARDVDECFDWPYGIRNGYGSIWVDGKTYRVNRLALIRTSGDAPEGKRLALHSCNNPLCFNPRHLRWGSHKENEEDKVKDGTALVGEMRHNAKLTEKNVILILSDNRRNGEIAKQYNVTRDAIYKIKSGKNWKYLRSKI